MVPDGVAARLAIIAWRSSFGQVILTSRALASIAGLCDAIELLTVLPQAVAILEQL
jgi:hypothetical protein